MPQTTFPKYTVALAGLLAVWGVVAASGPKFIPGQVALVIGLALLAGIFLRHLRLASPPLPAALFVLLAILSAAWADWGVIAATSAVGLGVILLAADTVRTYLTPDKILRWLDIGFKLAIAVSLALMVIAPHVAIEQRWPNVGALTGIYVHKNHLGTVAAFGFITMLYAPRARSFPKAKLLFWLAAYVATIYLVRSSTAIILVALALGAVFLLKRIAKGETGKRGFKVASMSVAVIGAGLLAMMFADQILGLVGRDLTFNGRGRIWEGVLDAASRQPWLGYGWESTFREGTDASRVIMAHTGWLVPHAHSGFLSVLLQLGWVGAFLFGFMIIRAFLRTLKRIVAEPSNFSQWSFLVVVFYLVNNLVDNRVDGISWFLFALAYAGTFTAAKKPTVANLGRPYFTRDIKTGRLVSSR